MSNTILGCIDEKYSVKVPLDVKRDIFEHVVPHLGGIDALESSLRRFIICYLRGDDPKQVLDPESPFAYYLGFVRWPKGVDMEAEVVSEDGVFGRLHLKHCHALLSELHEKIKERENENFSPPPPPPPPSSGGVSSGGGAVTDNHDDGVCLPAQGARRQKKSKMNF